ncbi:MAG TPA: ATP-binding protein [Ignavibacteria bacterium]|nr:ATP-binding protein [Ignavibacteria bacterium]
MTTSDYIFIFICIGIVLILAAFFCRKSFSKVLTLKKEIDKKDKLFRAITSGCLDGFCMLAAQKDNSGHVRDFVFKEINNLAAKQKHLQRKDVIGKTLSEANPIYKERGFIELFSEVYRSGKPFEQEYTMPDGHYETWFYQQIIPYQDGVIVFNRDISKRKLEAEKEKLLTEKLLEANQNKDRIISILAHDLRSPLSGIIGLTNIMSEEYNELTDSEIKDYLNTTAKTATDIFNLLDNLLEWARIKTGKKEIEPIVFDLRTQVDNVIELLQLNALTKGIEIKNDVPFKTLVNADKNCINSILRNLISNAIKFTRDNGKIIITAVHQSDKVMTSIIDNGLGISKKKLEKIFNSDMQSTAGTNFEKGSGFGLIICKDLIEKNGGCIWVESIEGDGSTFNFSLPAFK